MVHWLMWGSVWWCLLSTTKIAAVVMATRVVITVLYKLVFVISSVRVPCEERHTRANLMLTW
jgi:hypothetical protein